MAAGNGWHPRTLGTTCPICEIPVDAEQFDDADIVSLAGVDVGQRLTLARFDLRPQYCAVLQYFAQFTDASAQDPAAVVTEELEWSLLANGTPVFPYIAFRTVLNPWGNGSFQVSIRLDEGSTIEFAVRRVAPRAGHVRGPQIGIVGGRILGRYWYNPAYGDGHRHA